MNILYKLQMQLNQENGESSENKELCVRLQSESIGVRIPSSPNLHLSFLPSTGAVCSNSGTGQSGRICAKRYQMLQSVRIQ